jgi:hypothetical protein
VHGSDVTAPSRRTRAVSRLQPLRHEGIPPGPDAGFRPCSPCGSVLARTAWEVWDAKGEPLARYGNLLTGYGLGVFAEILLRVVLGAVLL